MSDEARSGKYQPGPMADRQTQTLMGIAQGLLADGYLCDDEIAFLQKWLVANTAIRSNAVLSLFIERVDKILRTAPVDEEERAELTSLLKELTANDFELGEFVKSTRLPLCKPEPKIDFSRKQFCLTGTFNFGTRKVCEAEIYARGGDSGPVSTRTDYLVIGSYVTSAWKHERFGRKIEKAIRFREKYGRLAIVSETNWERALQKTRAA